MAILLSMQFVLSAGDITGTTPMPLWEKQFEDDFARCEKCAPLTESEEDKWCPSCKQNFAYIWKLENMTQTLQAGMDKVSKILLGLSYVIEPEKAVRPAPKDR